MENTNTPEFEVSTRTKVLQYVAIGLFVLINIPYVNKLTGNEIYAYINQFSIPIIYGILAFIASNKPTRISLAIFTLTRLINAITVIHAPFEPIMMSLVSFGFTISCIAKLYMYGMVVRNNKLDNKSLLSINVLFGIMLFQLIMDPILPLIITYRDYISIICNIFSCIPFFFFARSSAFSGIYDNTQPIKGAYRFWNKYIKYYLIALGIVIISTIIMAETIY